MADFLTRIAQRAVEPASLDVRPDLAPTFVVEQEGSDVSSAREVARGESSPAAETGVGWMRARDASQLQPIVERVSRPDIVGSAARDSLHDPGANEARRGSTFLSERAMTAAHADARLRSEESVRLSKVEARPAPLPVTPRVSRDPQRVDRMGNAAASSSSQAIHISIGRIEVRAITPAPTPRSRQSGRTPPELRTLDDYLRKRNGAGT